MRYTEYSALSPDARAILDELVQASGVTVVSFALSVIVNGRPVDLGAFVTAVDRHMDALRAAAMHFTQIKNVVDVALCIEHNPTAPFKAAWEDMLMDDEQYDMGYTKEEYIDEAYKHL